MENIIEYIKKNYDKTFYIKTHSDWSSNKIGFRLNIRRAIFNITKQSQVLNLSLPPTLHPPSRHISISHCEVQGGFILSSLKVGLDLEDYSRLSTQVIKSVSNNDELQLLPQEIWPLLWTIKESTFKSHNSTSQIIQNTRVTKYIKQISHNYDLIITESTLEGKIFHNISNLNLHSGIVTTISIPKTFD